MKEEKHFCIFRSEEVILGDRRRAGDGFGKKNCLLKKLRLY